MSITVKSAGGGGLSSTDVTASSAQVLSGYTALTTDSNDEAKLGTIGTWNGEKRLPEFLPLGGRVFYVGADNGATYTFYDASNNVISDQTISGLATATKYTISGTPSADKFYIYDNASTWFTGYNWGIDQSVEEVPGTLDTAIGQGKNNTNLAIAALGTSDTVWKYVKENYRDVSYQSCNDWYIGNTEEYNQLKASGLTDYFSEAHRFENLGCSREEWTGGSYGTYVYVYALSRWSTTSKNAAYYYVPIRSI